MKVSKKSIATGLLALGLVTTAGAGVTAAAGMNGNGFNGPHGPGFGGGRAEVTASLLGITVDELQARIENGEDPRELLEAAGITKEDIKAANEARMQERLAQRVASGDLTQEEADEILARKAEHQAKHEAVETALENNDYDAFVAAVDGTPMADNIDEATFAKLVEAHNLHEAGDHEGARAIMDELGFHPLGFGGPRGHHKGHGPHGDNDEAGE